MSVKIKKSNEIKIVGKGLLEKINSDGFMLIDDDGSQLLPFSAIQELIGKEVSISVTNKVEK